MRSKEIDDKELAVWSIQNQGTYASVHVDFPHEESSIHCESDAIITMTDDLKLFGEVRGGLLAGIFRRFLTEETFFVTTVRRIKSRRKDHANNHSMLPPANLLLAANEPGDVMLHQLTPKNDLLLTKGAYVAADASVDVSTKLHAGLGRGKMSGTGLFLIRAYGSGTIACSAFGAIHRFDLQEGEKRIVDNGHLIGWSAKMHFKVGKATESLISTFTSGEGIMLHFMGPGTIYVQSHTPKVELLAAAATTRKRKGAKLVAGIVGILILVVGINLYFFLKTHEPFLRLKEKFNHEKEL